jgi:hypothetical protein
VPLKEIISGGQTGVDRGALEAALDLHFPCGGWCPPGRIAEDGPIDSWYPVKELETGGYRERTKRNVVETDGTVIIYWKKVEGGTKLTANECVRRKKPHLLIDADSTEPSAAVLLMSDFVRANNVSSLNVAGPRASKVPHGRDYAHEVVRGLIEREASTV